MSIAPKCDRCGDELAVPGALVFGPPEANRALKLHTCAKCWPDVWAFATGRASRFPMTGEQEATQ